VISDVKNIKQFVSDIAERFVKAETTTLASSVAFYTALSLAPLLILFVTLCSQLSLDLQTAFNTQVEIAAGPDAARTVELIVENAKERPDLANLSGILGLLALLFSASLIFGEMKFAFNKIFECKTPPPHDETFWVQIGHWLKLRLSHIVTALGSLLLMITTLVISSTLSAIAHESHVWRNLNLGVSSLFYMGFFTLLFRYLPDIRTAWGNAARGGLITALLFVIGKELISLYLGKSAIGSAYGVAGSAILLLVWVYYSVMIIFIGAHVSSWLNSRRDLRRSLVKHIPLFAR
jgi:membrane protein